MNTYVFMWNAKKGYSWDTLKNDIEELKETGKFVKRWSSGNRKSINAGDRAFLLKVGKEPKGIIGAGFVISPSFKGEHWDQENKLANYVEISFETILDPEGPILTLDILDTGKLSERNWEKL